MWTVIAVIALVFWLLQLKADAYDQAYHHPGNRRLALRLALLRWVLIVVLFGTMVTLLQQCVFQPNSFFPPTPTPE